MGAHTASPHQCDTRKPSCFPHDSFAGHSQAPFAPIPTSTEPAPRSYLHTFPPPQHALPPESLAAKGSHCSTPRATIFQPLAVSAWTSLRLECEAIAPLESGPPTVALRPVRRGDRSPPRLTRYCANSCNRPNSSAEKNRDTFNHSSTTARNTRSPFRLSGSIPISSAHSSNVGGGAHFSMQASTS